MLPKNILSGWNTMKPEGTSALASGEAGNMYRPPEFPAPASSVDVIKYSRGSRETPISPSGDICAADSQANIKNPPRIAAAAVGNAMASPILELELTRSGVPWLARGWRHALDCRNLATFP